MLNRTFGALGAAVIASTLGGTVAQAPIVGEPCETCGVALGAPLP